MHNQPEFYGFPEVTRQPSGPSYIAPSQPRSFAARMALNTGIVYLGGETATRTTFLSTSYEP